MTGGTRSVYAPKEGEVLEESPIGTGTYEVRGWRKGY